MGNWAGDRDHFNQYILPRLKVRGPEIGKASDRGDMTATLIIRYHLALQRKYDPVTAVALEEVLLRWEEANKPV